MRTIRQLQNKEKPVFFKFESSALCYRFLSEAQLEGLTLVNRRAPCTHPADDLLVLLPCGEITAAGFAGRVLFSQGGGSVIRIDYRKYLSGCADYYFCEQEGLNASPDGAGERLSQCSEKSFW